MSVLDAKSLREDIVASLITENMDLETSEYLDRILELAEMEEAEHQFLNDPFDRSVALVLQLFQSKDLDPWAVDLSAFLEMFSSRIEDSEHIDLPTCGRLIRMAWQVLRGKLSPSLRGKVRKSRTTTYGYMTADGNLITTIMSTTFRESLLDHIKRTSPACLKAESSERKAGQ